MPWQVKPGCAGHHRSVVERIVNLPPPAWQLVFNDLEHCERRLRGYSFAEGFNIVRKGGELKDNFSLRFLCFHYEIIT